MSIYYKKNLIGRINNININKKIFNNVDQMKLENLSEGEFVQTLGYNVPGDNGGGIYKIVSLNDFIKNQPSDLTITKPDEFGNHTLNNGLIAELQLNETTPEQWGAQGIENFNNCEAFIHMFAHIKTGSIHLKPNTTYMFDDIWETYKNEYKTSMIGKPLGGYETSKPLLANVSNLIVYGNDATLLVKQFAKSDRYDVDFSIFQLGGYISNLTIANLNINGNCWEQDISLYKSNYRNHGIAYLGSRNEAHTISNLTIKNCNFYNLGGINSLTNDFGGDGCLIMMPSNIYKITLKNNYFENVGRWSFAIDTAANSLSYEMNDIKIINNEMYQDPSTIELNSKGDRSLGFIDFEARYNWKNVLIENNKITSPSVGIAFGGGECESNNVIINNNIIKQTKSTCVGYWYLVYIYGQKIFSNLQITNNKIEIDTCRSDYMVNFNNVIVSNLTFKNNDIIVKNSKNELILSLNSSPLSGEILIESNKIKAHKGIQIYTSTILESQPDVTVKINNNDFIDCNYAYYILLMNNNNLECYKYINLNIKNNLTKNYYLNLLDSNKITITDEPIYFNHQYFSESKFVQQATPFLLNTIVCFQRFRVGYEKNGVFNGIYYKNWKPYKNEDTICTENGYGFLSYDTVNGVQTQWQASTEYSSGKILQSGNNLYMVVESGTSGTVNPTHTSGILEDDNLLKFRYIGKLATFN